MTAADDARRWADLAGTADKPKPLPTGLEDRKPAGPDAISPNEFFEAEARRLLAEDATS